MMLVASFASARVVLFVASETAFAYPDLAPGLVLIWRLPML